MPAVKLKQREPNGRHKRPSAEERKRRERDAYQVEMQTVLKQPHRRGMPQPDHRWCSTALGRFCLKHRVRRELHDCTADYAAVVRRLWAAKGVPNPDGTGEAGSGVGPSDATVRGWEREVAACERAMIRCLPGRQGHIAMAAVRHIAVDPRPHIEMEPIPPEYIPAAIQGMLALANHKGHRLKHPFV